MATSRLFKIVSGLLLSVIAALTFVNKANAEGECLQACTPCTTPEGELSQQYDCSISFETTFDVFGNKQIRIWGYAPPGMIAMIGRGDTYPDAYKYTPLASDEIGFDGQFVTYDVNPPTDSAVVQYFLYILEGDKLICSSSVNMNLMPAYAPLPSETVIMDPPGSVYTYNNGDVFTNSIQANNSNFTGTLNFSGGTNNGQVFVNNGELDQSVTNVTTTVIISITNNMYVEQDRPVRKELKQREDRNAQPPASPVPVRPEWVPALLWNLNPDLFVFVDGLIDFVQGSVYHWISLFFTVLAAIMVGAFFYGANREYNNVVIGQSGPTRKV